MSLLWKMAHRQTAVRAVFDDEVRLVFVMISFFISLTYGQCFTINKVNRGENNQGSVRGVGIGSQSRSFSVLIGLLITPFLSKIVTFL